MIGEYQSQLLYRYTSQLRIDQQSQQLEWDQYTQEQIKQTLVDVLKLSKKLYDKYKKFADENQNNYQLERKIRKLREENIQIRTYCLDVQNFCQLLKREKQNYQQLYDQTIMQKEDLSILFEKQSSNLALEKRKSQQLLKLKSTQCLQLKQQVSKITNQLEQSYIKQKQCNKQDKINDLRNEVKTIKAQKQKLSQIINFLQTQNQNLKIRLQDFEYGLLMRSDQKSISEFHANNAIQQCPLQDDHDLMRNMNQYQPSQRKMKSINDSDGNQIQIIGELSGNHNNKKNHKRSNTSLSQKGLSIQVGGGCFQSVNKLFRKMQNNKSEIDSENNQNLSSGNRPLTARLSNVANQIFEQKSIREGKIDPIVKLLSPKNKSLQREVQLLKQKLLQKQQQIKQLAEQIENCNQDNKNLTQLIQKYEQQLNDYQNIQNQNPQNKNELSGFEGQQKNQVFSFHHNLQSCDTSFENQQLSQLNLNQLRFNRIHQAEYITQRKNVGNEQSFFKAFETQRDSEKKKKKFCILRVYEYAQKFQLKTQKKIPIPSFEKIFSPKMQKLKAEQQIQQQNSRQYSSTLSIDIHTVTPKKQQKTIQHSRIEQIQAQPISESLIVDEEGDQSSVSCIQDFQICKQKIQTQMSTAQSKNDQILNIKDYENYEIKSNIVKKIDYQNLSENQFDLTAQQKNNEYFVAKISNKNKVKKQSDAINYHNFIQKFKWDFKNKIYFISADRKKGEQTFEDFIILSRRGIISVSTGQRFFVDKNRISKRINDQYLVIFGNSQIIIEKNTITTTKRERNYFIGDLFDQTWKIKTISIYR